MALDYEYDPSRDVLTVEGVEFEGEFFRWLGSKVMPRGTTLRICDEQVGVVFRPTVTIDRE